MGMVGGGGKYFLADRVGGSGLEVPPGRRGWKHRDFPGGILSQPGAL